MAARLTVTGRVLLADRTFTVTGKEAQTLLLLVEKGARGIVAYDFRGGPPFRLGAYVCELRHRFEIAIRTEREPHQGGSHARYILEDQVEILPSADHAEARAA